MENNNELYKESDKDLEIDDDSMFEPRTTDIYIMDSDLRKQKYPMDILEKNVFHLSFAALLHWQTLDAEFCRKYILNESYQDVEEWYLITHDYVLKKQPHLKMEDLIDPE